VTAVVNPALVVVEPGPLTTVQDLGRPGWASLGVTTSGAADRSSLRRANRLVGNREDAAGLEITLGGLRVCAVRPLTLAVTGAVCPLTVDGGGVGRNAVLELETGQVLAVGLATAGVRTYLAVRGGVDVPVVLGSRSRDTLAGLGPDPLRSGQILAVGDATAGWPTTEVAPVPDPPSGEVRLRVVPGPRQERLGAGALELLTAASWQVDPAGDRVGLRLRGPTLPTGGTASGGWPSEGLVRGAIQVPPNGLPVVFLADHPVTGGYPVLACLGTEDADRAAQLRPGQSVRMWS